MEEEFSKIGFGYSSNLEETVEKLNSTVKVVLIVSG